MHTTMNSTFLGSFVYFVAFACGMVCVACGSVFLAAVRQSVAFAALLCVFSLSFVVSGCLLSTVSAVARSICLCSALYPNETRAYLNSYLSTAAGEGCGIRSLSVSSFTRLLRLLCALWLIIDCSRAGARRARTHLGVRPGTWRKCATCFSSVRNSQPIARHSRRVHCNRRRR